MKVDYKEKSISSLGQKNIDNEPAEMNSKKREFRLSKQTVALIIVFLLCGILYFISWKSTAFCDWYNANVFPLWQNTYGRLTSILPFSFGEILIMIAVFGIPLSLVAMVVLLIVLKRKRKKVGKIFGYVYAWIVAFVVATETLNCFIMYHCSTFAELNNITVTEHTHEELEQLGYIIVNKLDELSPQVQRDDEGHFILTDDLDETAKDTMEKLSDEFENLDGFYATPKPVICSFFMSQMDLMGVYFPFSMEANYNNDMYKAKLPDTVCHELAHTKGYIQEDEANFIAFMACDRSDSVEYQYSGYLSVLTQVRNKIFEYADDDTKIAFDSAIDENVWVDISSNYNYWHSVKEKEDTVFDSETVSEIADNALDANLKINGVEDGTQSYGRVVDLLLNYFADDIKG